MFSEIMDALEDYYIKQRNEPEIVVDCLMWLREEKSAKELYSRAYTAIEKLGYCPRCGNEYVTETYREPHYELDHVEYETMTNIVCPVCGNEKEA